ncbi:helix-turn-helix domain-containing protein [Actinosynnema pretiosum subsp. pretiosum]|uniref:DUF5753 domain-containing protein n=2 Tax=Actinosynnema TaxID=40566 RepID=C6WG37_ACTMD|nr:helix-turn-helix transcriptional regulator [Actinosynnema mirum]ACU39801.1 hypothetical protein Amir_5994 [Actinosynnema mirum DSM 43827]AXX33313.1 Putative DNA-binding protein in cluster with Type I restriction-modification system [Actinosynnema pretiosum subsp. pretiosum]QUF02860.1 helix-turn-helix domain-containing protein [Actinosynnema pretiosum subsp. pretiosum]
MEERDPGPVVQRLIYGVRAREYRETANLEPVATCEKLDIKRVALSKCEAGLVADSETATERKIVLYGLLGPEAEEFRRLGKEARRRAAPERVTDHGRQYVAIERAATELRMAYPEVPGALQTAAYARAQFMNSPIVRPSDLTSWAEVRERRGDLLAEEVVKATGKPRRVSLVIGEEALHRMVGGRAVMRAQLRRLLMFADLPHFSLRVFPFSAGSSTALSCPFTLLWIEPANVHLAYAENITGADYMKTTHPYVVAYDDAQRRALSESDSRALLESRVNEL